MSWGSSTHAPTHAYTTHAQEINTNVTFLNGKDSSYVKIYKRPNAIFNTLSECFYLPIWLPAFVFVYCFLGFFF